MAASEGVRVLVVDDDPDIRAVVGMALEDEGYAVEAAGDGAEGLAAVERQRPDVILLDMRMPGATDGNSPARTGSGTTAKPGSSA